MGMFENTAQVKIIFKKNQKYDEIFTIFEYKKQTKLSVSGESILKPPKKEVVGIFLPKF